MSDLGNVEFRIDANTKALDEAKAALSSFSSSAKSLQTALDRHTKALEGSFKRIERATKQAAKADSDYFSNSAKQAASFSAARAQALKRVEDSYRKEIKALQDLAKQGQQTAFMQNNLTRSYEASVKHIKNNVQSTNDINTVMNRFRTTLTNTQRDIGIVSQSLEKSAATQKKAAEATTVSELQRVRAIGQTNIALEAMTARLNRSGGDSQKVAAAIANLNQQHRKLTDTLKQDNLTRLDAEKAMQAWNMQLARTREQLVGLRHGDRALGGINQRMTDLTKSVQVALGPLSGVASRITAITALANKNNIAVAGLIGSFIAFGTIMYKSIRAAGDMEVALAVLDQRVLNAGESLKWTTEQLYNLAIELGENTMAGTREAVTAINMLATVTGITGENLEDALYQAQALAQLDFSTLQAAAQRLATVLEDPAASLNSLRRAGISFSDSVKEQITTLTVFGKTAEAHALILDEMAKRTEGVASAAGDTMAAAMDTLIERVANFFRLAASGGATTALADSINNVSDHVLHLTKNTHLLERAFLVFEKTVYAFSAALEFAIVNANLLVGALAGLAAVRIAPVIGGIAVSLLDMTSNMRKATTATNAARTAVVGLGAAVRAINPILAVVGTLAAVFVSDFFFGTQEAASSTLSLAEALDVAEKSLAGLTEGYGRLSQAQLRSAITDQEAVLTAASRRVQELTSDLANAQTVLDSMQHMQAAGVRMEGLQEVQDAINQLTKDLEEAAISSAEAEERIAELNAQLQAMGQSRNTLADIAREFDGIIPSAQSAASAVAGISKELNSLTAATGRAADSGTTQMVRATNQIISSMAQTATAIHAANRELEMHAEFIARVQEEADDKELAKQTDEYKASAQAVQDLTQNIAEAQKQSQDAAISLGDMFATLSEGSVKSLADLEQQTERLAMLAAAAAQGEKAFEALEKSFEIQDSIARYEEQLRASIVTDMQAVAMKQALGTALENLGVSTAVAAAAMKALDSELEKVTMSEEEILERVAAFAESIRAYTAATDGLRGGSKSEDIAIGLDRENDALRRLIEAHKDSADAAKEIHNLNDIRATLIDEKLIPATSTLAEVEDILASTQNKRIKQLSDLMKAQQGLTEAEEAYASVRQSLDELEQENDELRRQNVAILEGKDALEQLNDEIAVERQLRELRGKVADKDLARLEKEIRANQRLQRELAKNVERIEEQERQFKKMVDGAVDYGADMFADMFSSTENSWAQMWENMRQTMISSLVRMAAEAALRPIIVSIGASMAGAFGMAVPAGAAGIGGGGMFSGGGGMPGIGSLSDLSSIFNASGGSMMPGVDAWAQANLGFGSIGEMARPTAGFIGPMPAQTAGLLNGGSAMAGFASLGNVLGIAGSALPGLMSGNYAQAGFGAAGAAIGTALLPGIGTAIGGFLGNAVGSLFGGGDKDQEIRPISYAPSSGRGRQTPLRGIELDTTRYKGGGAFKDAVQQADEAIAQYLSDQMVQQVRDFLDTRGTIRGKKRDNKEIGEKHIRRALREMYNPVIEALGGTEAAKAFSDMTSSAKPEKVLETAVEIATFLGQLNDETLFRPQEISQLEAAWKALNTQIDDATEMAEQLGQSLEEVARLGEEARQAFHDEIQQGYQDQIDAMLRPAEFAWRQLREAQAKEIKELEKIDASTAKARQWHQLQIRALFEQNYELQRMYLEGLIDLSDDLNAQIGALWGIATTGINSLIQDSNAAYQEAIRLGRQYAQINRNLQQTIAGLRTGPQSPLSIEQQLMEALDRFRQTLGDALGGDSEAAQQLQQLVNPVLELAQQFFGRTEGYAQIFDELVRGLEMAGVSMETPAGGYAAMAAALDSQILILQEIADTLNQRDELGEDFEARYNKLTSELEEVGFTIGGINAFLQDAADAIPSLIVSSFASGLDSAQLAKRMGELFQATVTATEQAMRTGVEDLTGAIDDAQQALLTGWIPDFIELAEAFNGTIPEVRFDRVTARVVAHYETSAEDLGRGLKSAVAQVHFDGLEQNIYAIQELVGDRFNAAVGGISFEGIDGTYLESTIYNGITGVAEAVQVSLEGQAQRIDGIISDTLEAFTLDATRATILNSVDLINRGATRVELAFGRVEGALLRLSNNADGHIVAMIDEVDTAIARFVNWGQGSLIAGIEQLRADLVDVRNVAEGALLLFADTVEAQEARIANLGPGSLRASVESLRSGLVTIRNAGEGTLTFWADEVEAQETRISNLGPHPLRVQINNLRSSILTIRNAGKGTLELWANEVAAQQTRIANLGAGTLLANIDRLETNLLNIRNAGQGRLLFWADRVAAQTADIRNLDIGELVANIKQLRTNVLRIRNAGQGRLAVWGDRVEAQRTSIANLDAGDLIVNIRNLRTNILRIRNAGQGRLNFWANEVKAQQTTIENLGVGHLITRINNLRSSLLTIRNTGQGRLLFWAEKVRAETVRIEDLGTQPIMAGFNNFRASIIEVRAASQQRLNNWKDVVSGNVSKIQSLDGDIINTRANELRTRLVNTRNVSQNKLADWRNRVNNHLERIRDLDQGNISLNANELRARLVSTRNTAQNRLKNWSNQVQNQLNKITELSNDLGGGNIAAQLKKIVENRLPTRFQQAIDRAFKDVFGTSNPTNFLNNMTNLVGANSALVKALRDLSHNMFLLARKDQIDAFAADVGARAEKAMKVPSLQGARGKLNADQGWENQGHSYARINYSASKGFTMGSTYKSGGSGSSQLNKMKTRAQELMDQLNHLVSVNRIAIDPSKLPSTLELNSRKGKASAQQIFDDLMKRGAVVARVDDPKDHMLKRMATELHRLVGGTLPKYGANYKVSGGKLQMDLWAGSRSLTRTGSQLTDLNDIAGQFLQMLKHEIKVSSKIEPLLKAIDFRPGGLGPQGGLEQLARSLMEHGLGTSNVPKFAQGGIHTGGVRLVGERGPELEFTGPSRILSTIDSQRFLANTYANDNRQVVYEIRALRAENAELRRVVQEGFGDSVQAEGVSGSAIREEIRNLGERLEDLEDATRQQTRRMTA